MTGRRVRNADNREYLHIDEEPIGTDEQTAARTEAEEATAKWLALMPREGRTPREVIGAPVDSVPKRIGPANVPMGGSSMGSI